MRKNLALEQIYLSYVQDVYRYIYSLCKNEALAEDIVQETFYRAYFYVEDFKEEKVKPWLFKVAYHTFIDTLRKEKRITYYEDFNQLHTKIGSARSTEEEFFIKNSIEQWFAIIDNLSMKKKNTILLREYYHFSYKEIADILNISLANVKVTLYRVRKEIQRKMNK